MKITLKVLGIEKTIDAHDFKEIHIEVSNDDTPMALDINIHADGQYVLGSWIDLSVKAGSFEINEGDNTIVLEE